MLLSETAPALTVWEEFCSTLTPATFGTLCWMALHREDQPRAGLCGGLQAVAG